VSLVKPQCAMFVGAFEREAIRPYVAGKFADMVEAVERHPAMQIYLDNAQSIGPDSMAGRRTGKGLNENLAVKSWSCIRSVSTAATRRPTLSRWRKFSPAGASIAEWVRQCDDERRRGRQRLSFLSAAP